MSSSSNKPHVTATAHLLPYDQLSPRDFERLCLGLVARQGYQHVEHLGASGGEQGRDIQAELHGERIIFQCKRVKSFGAADAEKEVDKILGLPVDKRPVELIFLVTCDVSVQARQAAQARSGQAFACSFWAATELDEKVKRCPELVREFFQGQAAEQSQPVFDQRGQTVHGQQTIINEATGPVFSGNFQGAVHVENRHEIKVGEIHAERGTVNIAGGDINQSSVNQSSSGDAQAIALAFMVLQQRVAQLPDEEQKEDARGALQKLEAEAHKGDQPNESRVRQWLDFLAGMSGDIFEVAVATFTNPLSGLSLAFRKIAERAKEERARQ
jgi:hypothetical protein